MPETKGQMNRYPLHEDIKRQRYEEIPHPIREVGKHNAAVNRLCQEYMIGRICTLQEALCQMVLVLNVDWTNQQRAYMELMQVTNQPPFIPVS